MVAAAKAPRPKRTPNGNLGAFSLVSISPVAGSHDIALDGRFFMGAEAGSDILESIVKKWKLAKSRGTGTDLRLGLRLGFCLVSCLDCLLRVKLY